jgi:hypothetical protein
MRYLKSFNESLNSLHLSEEKFIEILKDKCKKFLKCIEKYPDGSLILRKDEWRGDYVFVNPKNSSTLRVDPYSANDIHNLLVSNLNSWKDWPKRNKSLCCASEARALTHGVGFVNYVVIPFDTTKVAVCDSSDFWESFPKLPKYFSTSDSNKRASLPNYIDSLLSDLGSLSSEWNPTSFDHIIKGVDTHGKPFTKKVNIPGRWVTKIKPEGIDKNWKVLESFLQTAKLDDKLIDKYFKVGNKVIWDNNLTLLENLNVILNPVYNNFKLGDVDLTMKLYHELDYDEGEALESWFEDESIMIRLELLNDVLTKLNYNF